MGFGFLRGCVYICRVETQPDTQFVSAQPSTHSFQLRTRNPPSTHANTLRNALLLLPPTPNHASHTPPHPPPRRRRLLGSSPATGHSGFSFAQLIRGTGTGGTGAAAVPAGSGQRSQFADCGGGDVQLADCAGECEALLSL